MEPYRPSSLRSSITFWEIGFIRCRIRKSLTILFLTLWISPMSTRRRLSTSARWRRSPPPNRSLKVLIFGERWVKVQTQKLSLLFFQFRHNKAADEEGLLFHERRVFVSLDKKWSEGFELKRRNSNEEIEKIRNRRTSETWPDRRSERTEAAKETLNNKKMRQRTDSTSTWALLR